MNNNLKWTSLEERRTKSKITLFYKLKNNMCYMPTEDLKRNTTRITRRSDNGYVVPGSRTDAHIFSFYPSAIRLWNHLPADIKNSESLEIFKGKLSKFNVLNLKQSYNQGHFPVLANNNTRLHTGATKRP